MAEPVKTKKELIDRLLYNQKRILSYGVERLGVFGSFVRDQAKENSDVDFFIHFEPERKTFKNFMRLAETLEEITGRKIEMVTPQSLSKYIGPYILKEVEYVSLAA
ncbi:MAG: nucleotidyltransferase family protein [Bacteroidia bacterium]|nr:nucleotidyltransferase family protein [Bacteroidia bacterium]